MKAFIAMSAIALVLAPPTITTTHAQLNTVPRRLRANKEANDWGRRDNAPQASKAHRQMTRDGHRIRTIAPVQEVVMSLSMPMEDSITSPVPALDQNTFDIDNIESDPCLVPKVIHSKKQCRKAINRGEQCAWNTADEICEPIGTTRRLTRALEESESMSMSMQFDMLTTPERDGGWRRQLQTLDVDLSMSMPMQTDAITQAQFNEVDPCASLSSKRRCRKNRSQVAGSTCSWDNNSGTCQSTTFDSRRMTSNIGEDGVWGRELEDLADGLSMSMPKGAILISDTSTNEATVAAIEPTEATVAATETTEATVAATEVDPCASLATVRQCRKNGSQVASSTCSWNNIIGKCQSAAAIEATEATVAATETTEATAAATETTEATVAATETTTTTTATATTTVAADPCAELNRKRCRRMDGCTWDNEVCYTAPPATTTAATVAAVEGDGNDFLAPPGFNNTPNSSGNGNNSPTAAPVIELTPFPTLGPRFVEAEEAEQEFILSNLKFNLATSLVVPTTFIAVVCATMMMIM